MNFSAERAPEITNSSEERNQITEFSDDQASIIENAPGEAPIRGIGMAQHTDASQHDVISYLQRPQMIGQYVFACSAKRRELINPTPILIPENLLKTMAIAKLDGFTSFRATAVLKLQINAQPFQAGRLIMYACPMPGLVTPRDKYLNQHVTLAQQVHNVQIDVAQQTEVTLRVPFVSPFNSYDLINGQWSWAAVNIMVYSPLNETEQTNLRCLLWGHFEDIDLGAPTSGRIKIAVQQSVSTLESSQGAPKEPSNLQVMAARATEQTGVIDKVQGGLLGLQNKIEGILPGPLKIFPQIQKHLINIGTPILGPLIKGITGLFGFSKPVLGHSGETIVARPTQFFANVNGNDHAHVLSLDVLNAIDEYPALGGTELDETSFDFLKSIPQYIKKFEYGSADDYDYGKELFRAYVCPLYDVPLQITGRTNYLTYVNYQPPNILKYITSPFVYWTGSLVYTFRFVKTRFHSGRVEVGFHPFVADVDTDRMDYVYRVVVDLRDNSEVSVTIPYISPTPWKIVDTTIDPFKVQTWAEVGQSVTGVLYVRALTPLICASSIISNTIECVVEVRAGSDFQVQCPVKSPYLPVSLQNKLKIAKQESGVYAVPGTAETRTLAIQGKEAPSISGSASDINRPSTENFCAGERFSNFRSFSRRFGFAEEVIKSTDVSFNIHPAEIVRCPLLKFFDFDVNENIIGLTRCPVPLNFVSGMYTFYRGSVRLKVYSKDKPELISAQIVFRPDYKYLSSVSINKLDYVGPIAYEQPQIKGFAEFQIPYYSPTIITVPYPTEQITKLYSQPQITALISTSAASTNLNVAVAAGDDMSFHMFLGVPFVLPTMIMTTTHSSPDGSKQLPDFYNAILNVDPTQTLVSAGSPVSKPKAEYFLALEDFNFVDVSKSLIQCPKVSPEISLLGPSMKKTEVPQELKPTRYPVDRRGFAY